ncbi:NAD(P)-dependent oxidoreductase [Scytonema tolypothrichoides VB-61278]|nr:NAD(P)-dependent oxidoreductase [Scytonema tolypothrichoides VB-61278]
MYKNVLDNQAMQEMDRISGQKVLVTGGSGFLGSHLCNRLCQRGAEVHAVSRTCRSTNTNSLHWWQSNLESIDEIRTLFRTIRPKIVFHLSGYTTGAANLDLVLPTFDSLLVSTINLLTVVAEVGCDRIVLIASLEEPQPSHIEVTPASPYAAAKWASSAYGRMFHKLYQVPVVLARPFMTYGPGQNIHKVIPSVTLSLLQKQAPKLASGQRKVDWIYVDDVIEGFLLMATISGLEGYTIDLGSGTLVTIREAVEQLVSLLNSDIEPLFGALPDRPVEQERIADIAFAYNKIGWKPVTPLRKGLEQTVDWYRDQLKSSSPSFE